MGRIARESIEEVRRANDIVDVISGYLPLKKRGTGYWACCPFHDEQTPSFQVSSTRQTYKCFGCQQFGNVVDFVMAYEKLDFREATEKLANRGGVTLQFDGGGPSIEERGLRQRALDVMNWAQRGFMSHLDRNKAAQAYVDSRGLGGEIGQSWGLGYAPDEWTVVTDAARSKFDDEALLATGICRKNDEGRWYDFFRGRLTFPIRDAQGRIVGFGARLLDPNAKAQKYVNSAEGLLFHKSKLLYAIDRLAESKKLKQSGRALIMEGYTDVIAAHVHGFDNAVAPLGTALTAEQLTLLRRYTSKLTIVLDGDAAGIKAAERAVDIVLEAGADATVAVLPDQMDPYDYFRGHSPEQFQAVLDAARDAFQFKLDTLAKRHDLKRPVEAEQALGELAQTLARAASPSLRELYARTASNTLGIREAVVLAAVEKAHREHQAQQLQTRKTEEARAEGKPPESQTARSTGAQSQGVSAANYEREVLRRLLEHPAALKAAGDILDAQDFQSPALREVYREMLNAVDEHGEAVAGGLLSHLQGEARQELDRIVGLMGVPANLSAGQENEEANRLIDELKHFAQDRRAKAPHLAEKGSAQELELLRQRKKRRSTETST
ncbi:MAG: DNA primase [Planctomycetes bacterium]|nr:DNA primase [Planctomycetota bacterium]